MKWQHGTKDAFIDIFKHFRHFAAGYHHALVKIVGKRLPLLLECRLDLKGITYQLEGDIFRQTDFHRRLEAVNNDLRRIVVLRQKRSGEVRDDHEIESSSPG